MMTFASTAIPIVSTIPAIPGKVSVAPKSAITATNITTSATSAIFAKIPEIP